MSDPLVQLAVAIAEATPLLRSYTNTPDDHLRSACMPAIRTIATLATEIVKANQDATEAEVREWLASIFQPTQESTS